MAKTLMENKILKDTSGADISAVSGTKTSANIEIPGLSGFAIQISGTSAAQVDIDLSLDGTNWATQKTISTPTLPWIHEINETNCPFARVVITTGVSVTAKVSKVNE